MPDSTYDRLPPDPLISALKRERLRRGWTQRRMSRKIGVEQTALSAWERRVNEPSLSKLRIWCAHLGLELCSRPGDVDADSFRRVGLLLQD